MDRVDPRRRAAAPSGTAPAGGRFATPQRRAVRLGGEPLVDMTVLHPDPGFGLVVTARTPEVDLLQWAKRRRGEIGDLLLRHGVLLFRGFSGGANDLASFVAAMSEQPIPYLYRSTPRHAVGGNIYTASEYPPQETIPQHNENSYQRTWPLKLFLHCVTAAQSGGATPLCDSARVLARIPAATRRRFATKKVLYVRNYHARLDLPWQVVFQTDRRDAVEAYCRAMGIAYEWLPDGSLRTRQVRDACAVHPATSAVVWFNQAHLFHVSSLAGEVREQLAEMYREDELPRHAYYGDGSAIESAALDEIRGAYLAETRASPWCAGDIAVVDNMRVAHGREPFSGERRVLVAMTEPHGAA